MHPHRHTVRAPPLSPVNPLSVSWSPVTPPITARTHHHGNKNRRFPLEAKEQWGVEEIFSSVDNNHKTNNIITVVIVMFAESIAGTNIHNGVQVPVHHPVCLLECVSHLQQRLSASHIFLLRKQNKSQSLTCCSAGKESEINRKDHEIQKRM